MAKLDGKVAIVTGAARGLGRAYAKRLAGLGAKVAVADLNLHSYEEFEAEAKDMTADSTVAETEPVQAVEQHHYALARGRCIQQRGEAVHQRLMIGIGRHALCPCQCRQAVPRDAEHRRQRVRSAPADEVHERRRVCRRAAVRQGGDQRRLPRARGCRAELDVRPVRGCAERRQLVQHRHAADEGAPRLGDYVGRSVAVLRCGVLRRPVGPVSGRRVQVLQQCLAHPLAEGPEVRLVSWPSRASPIFDGARMRREPRSSLHQPMTGVRPGDNPQRLHSRASLRSSARSASNVSRRA